MLLNANRSLQLFAAAARCASTGLLSALLLTACALSSKKPDTGVTTAVTRSPVPVTDTTKSANPAAGGVTSTLPAPVPPEAQQQFDKAIALLKAGQAAPAAQQLQKISDAYPTYAGPLINLGLIELKANRYEPAAAYFKQALQRDPKSAAANNYLGVCYRYLGKFKDAESAYQQALASDDSYAIAHLNLGVLYDLYLQKPELALPEYERYQSLLATPDPKVAGYIKEISARLNAEKRKAASGAAP